MVELVECLLWLMTGGLIAWIGSRHNSLSTIILGALIIGCAILYGLLHVVPDSDDLHTKP